MPIYVLVCLRDPSASNIADSRLLSWIEDSVRVLSGLLRRSGVWGAVRLRLAIERTFLINFKIQG
jgi:hypothetical protein